MEALWISRTIIPMWIYLAYITDVSSFFSFALNFSKGTAHYTAPFSCFFPYLIYCTLLHQRKKKSVHTVAPCISPRHPNKQLSLPVGLLSHTCSPDQCSLCHSQNYLVKYLKSCVTEMVCEVSDSSLWVWPVHWWVSPSEGVSLWNAHDNQ